MNARCGECGSPVRLSHDQVFVCSRDAAHGRAIAFCGGKNGKPGPCPGDSKNAAPDHIGIQKAKAWQKGDKEGQLRVIDEQGGQHTYEQNEQKQWVHQATGAVGDSRVQNRLGIAAYKTGADGGGQKHSDVAFALGGEGSGIRGHVTERHKAAAAAHTSAAAAHTKLANAFKQMSQDHYDRTTRSTKAAKGSLVDNAAHAAEQATKATKTAGAVNAYAPKAAATYSKMAADTHDVKQKAAYHAEAARYHSGAARAHEVFSK